MPQDRQRQGSRSHRDGRAPEEVSEEIRERFGPYSNRAARLVAVLSERSCDLNELVQCSTLSRKSVEEILSILGEDVEWLEGKFRIQPLKSEAYRGRFTQNPRPPNSSDKETISQFVSNAPRPRAALDHVVATPDTAFRRASWLADHYDLDSSTLLFVGDHDLTSLATAVVKPDIRAIVLDIDEDLLKYIDVHARHMGAHIRAYYTDLRFTFPPEVEGSSDIAFTDPPYTPQGIKLFASQAVHGLRSNDYSQLIISYGFGEQHPTLGLKVQEELSNLGIVFDAIDSKFNRYYGAQAIGSSSDLYTCRPTSRTRKILGNATKTDKPNIYTHGPQSLEAASATLSTQVVQLILSTIGDVSDQPAGLVGDGWPISDNTQVVRLKTFFQNGLPGAVSKRQGPVAIDLRDDPGPWLLRSLLIANVPRLVAIVPDSHPDIQSVEGRAVLSNLLGAKYRLNFRRNYPSTGLSVLTASAVVTADQSAKDRLVRYLLDRSQGNLANAWREGLIYVSAKLSETTVTKNEARSVIQRATENAPKFASRLIDMPRHQIIELMQLVNRSITLPDR